MLIRDAVLSDLPAILEIYNDAVRNLTATFDLVEQTLEQRTVWFQKFGGRYPLIVAELDGETVGYSCLSPFRDKPAYGRSAELSVYIAANQRGKGIGRSLMAAILQRAADHEYHTVIGGITGGNAASVKLHESVGFRFVGSFKEVGFKFGEWQDVDFYQLLLPERE